MSKLETAIKDFLTNSNNLKLLENFKHSNWFSFSNEKKESILEILENTLAAYTNREPLTVDVDKYLRNSIEINEKSLLICEKSLNNGISPYIFLREYFFALKGLEQAEALSKGNIDNNISEQEFELWRKNNQQSLIDKNFRCFLEEDDPSHHFQPLSYSAHQFANTAIKAVTKTIYDHFGSDKYIESFYNQMMPYYRIFDDNQKRDKALKEVIERSKIIESEYKLIEDLMISDFSDVSGSNIDKLYMSMVPSINKLYSNKENYLIVELITRRELAKYGITKDIVLDKISVFNFDNIINNISETIINNIDQVNDKLTTQQKRAIKLNKVITSNNNFDIGMEPISKLKINIHLEIKSNLLSLVKKHTDNKKMIEDAGNLSYNFSYDRVINDYFGISEQDYYERLVESLRNNTPLKLESKKGLSDDFETELRSKVYEHVKSIHTSRWRELSYNEKLDFIQELEVIVSKHYGCKPVKVYLNKDIGVNGQYLPTQERIYINYKGISNQYKLIDTYFHEKRHHLQHLAVAGKVDFKELGLTKEDITLLARNELKKHSLGINNYVNDPVSEYAAQPQERDAFRWAHKVIFKLASDISRDLGEDPKIMEYLDILVRTCPYFDKSEQEHDFNLKSVTAKWDSNEKKLNKHLERLSIIEGNPKDLEKLSDEDFYYFFKESVWENLHLENKIRAAVELEKRESKKSSREEIFVMNFLNQINNSESASKYLEFYFKETFKRDVEYIVKNKDKFNEEQVEQLKKQLESKPEEEGLLLNKLNPFNRTYMDYMHGKLTRAQELTLADLERHNALYDALEFDYAISKHNVEAIEKELEYLLTNEKVVVKEETTRQSK